MDQNSHVWNTLVVIHSYFQIVIGPVPERGLGSTVSFSNFLDIHIPSKTQTFPENLFAWSHTDAYPYSSLDNQSHFLHLQKPPWEGELTDPKLLCV